MSKVLKRLQRDRNALLELIYHSAVEPDQWKTFMQRLVDLIDGHSAYMLFMNQGANQVQNSLAVNIDKDFHRQYVDHYVNACPWRTELHSKPKGRLYSTYHDFSCDHKGYQRTAFYNDWASHQNIEHGIFGTVHEHEGGTVQLLVQRTGESGHFTQEETTLTNELTPHLQRSLELQRHLESEKLMRTLGMKAAEAKALPFLILNNRLQVIHATSRALRVLEGSDAIRIKQDRLCCDEPSFHSQLQRLLKDTAKAQLGDWEHASGHLAIPSKVGSSLELITYPLHPAHCGFFTTGELHIVVYLNADAFHLRLKPGLAKARFQFSQTEITLAEALLNGKSLEQCADECSKSIHTVRTQCKQLLAKADCKRQGALMKRLLPYTETVLDYQQTARY